MAELEELDEPGHLSDLGMRLIIITILIGGLVVLSTSAYGSVEDLSGPATAPPTVTAAPADVADGSQPTQVRRAQSTVALEAVPAPPPIRVLTPEELAVVESESVEETDNGRLAPTGAADEEPLSLPTPSQPTTTLPGGGTDIEGSSSETSSEPGDSTGASDSPATSQTDDPEPETTVPANPTPSPETTTADAQTEPDPGPEPTSAPGAEPSE